jgi:hypothetical protein
VPEPRLAVLERIARPQAVITAAIEFVDIAGSSFDRPTGCRKAPRLANNCRTGLPIRSAGYG